MNPEEIMFYEKMKKHFLNNQLENKNQEPEKVYAESFDDDELDRVDKENTMSEDVDTLVDNFYNLLGDPDLFTKSMMGSPSLRSFYSGVLDGMLDSFLADGQ